MIVAVVEIAAPRERVFEALTDPKQVVAWWGSPETYKLTEWTVDLRKGGAWKSTGVGADGHKFSVGGEILEVSPPRLLVQTWRPDWDGGHTTTIRYALDPIPGGTRVTVRHEGFGDRVESCQRHGDGWQHVLAWLSGYVSKPNEAKYFMCRLIPPRPTFITDMTAEELAVMQAHAAYWKGLLAEGKAIVFGPVAEGFGLAVAKASSAEEMRTIEANDPVTRSGRGFKYEILPMLRATHA
jgi:uncharacterized protein YndB with AHSA1/START domain